MEKETPVTAGRQEEDESTAPGNLIPIPDQTSPMHGENQSISMGMEERNINAKKDKNIKSNAFHFSGTRYKETEEEVKTTIEIGQTLGINLRNKEEMDRSVIQCKRDKIGCP
ncbi:hypothetical protein L1987_59803 [Smallanthus sonchifolius]|uniref:Uncharacterized protein n=1 Tax=Smallanthus sonchifolius TaxID=185202 RepID=A0ACB9D6N7_9ASTR|nr:hypothetical protein L1987_59803 [Smallanthus sonchifolius]